jgi:mono/diheme cytochrome c family protein
VGFKRVVNLIEVLTLVTAFAFVIALFANEPGGGGGAAQGAPGHDVYLDNCATCHGQEGEGGVGPKLAGEVSKVFPNASDEVKVVEDGRGRMPSFKSRLSADEIREVVEYTRTKLK